MEVSKNFKNRSPIPTNRAPIFYEPNWFSIFPKSYSDVGNRSPILGKIVARWFGASDYDFFRDDVPVLFQKSDSDSTDRTPISELSAFLFFFIFILRKKK